MTVPTTERRLYRSRDAYVAGVCSGIADYFDLDPIVVRILAVLLAGLTLGLAGLVYIVFWVQLPLEPEAPAPYDVVPESAESNAYGCVDCGPGFDGTAGREANGGVPILARVAVAAGLMVLFLVVAVTLSPLVPGTEWWQYWPLALLIAGLCLIIIPVRSRFEMMWHALGIVITSAAASVLPMSLGVVSWKTIPCALEMLWPVLVLGVALFAVGLYRSTDALVLAGAFCFVAFCLLGCTWCVLPGELETFMMHMPGGRSVQFAVGR